ncbi:Guanine nucleotide-binding protein G(O) subunit alpha [Aphelenchoides fujianensis]|nr:Guanine nucleotide-binding protein G(O) subunit alpha [Aphelenchoides fujianensis]
MGSMISRRKRGAAAKRSKEIDRQLRDEGIEQSKVINLLFFSTDREWRLIATDDVKGSPKVAFERMCNEDNRKRGGTLDEIDFVCKYLPFAIIDASGIRTKVSKWLHHFEHVNALIFSTDVSKYNEKFDAVHGKNHLREALRLFDCMFNSPWLSEVSFILITYNVDVFEEKLKSTPLTVCFPKYNGLNEVAEAVDYVHKQFEARNRSPKRELYCHSHRQHLDETIWPFVFDCITDVIIANNLRGCGLY